MNGNIKDFKRELGELLKKYNVDICVEDEEGYGSDPILTVNTDNSYEEHYRFDGCCLDYKELLKEGG